MAFDCPARTRGPGGESPVRLFRLRPTEQATCLFLADQYGGLLTHWKAGGSVYCSGDGCGFKGCPVGRLWKAYTAVLIFDAKLRHWEPAVLEITEKLDFLLHGHDLRGQVWRLWRDAETGGRKQPCQGEYLRNVESSQLPRAWPLDPVLYAIYRRHDLKLNVANPTPRPIFVAPLLLQEQMPSPQREATEPKEEREKVQQLLRGALKDWRGE